MKAPEQSRPEPPAQPERGGSGSVLYIEDNPGNQYLVQQVLENYRPDVKLLTSSLGEIGLNLAQQNQPALILMDMDLPDMSGMEVFRNLKQFRETENIPVVAFSASSSASEIQKALDMGFKEELSKPFAIPDLLKVLTRYLGPPPQTA